MKARCLFFEAVFCFSFSMTSLVFAMSQRQDKSIVMNESEMSILRSCVFNDVTLIPNLVTIAILMNKLDVLHAPADVFISSFTPCGRLSNRWTHSSLNIVLSFLALRPSYLRECVCARVLPCELSKIAATPDLITRDGLFQQRQQQQRQRKWRQGTLHWRAQLGAIASVPY